MMPKNLPNVYATQPLRTTAMILAIIIGGVLLTAWSCNDGPGPSGQGQVHINQTGSSSPTVRPEQVLVDNCGGTETIHNTRDRKLDISMQGNIGVDAGVLRTSLGAQYGRSEGASIDLPAGPGTNMEFAVEWTDEPFFGTITVDGRSGQANYTVRVSTPRKTTSVDRGCIVGKYELVSWQEAPSPITIYMAADSGTLTINPAGDATWTMVIHSKGENPSPHPAITCKGRYSFASRKLEGVEGGNAADWTSNMVSRYLDLWLTFCGRAVTGAFAPFDLQSHALGSGNRTLEMKNGKGTMVWRLVK